MKSSRKQGKPNGKRSDALAHKYIDRKDGVFQKELANAIDEIGYWNAWEECRLMDIIIEWRERQPN